jgi:hypothetical protein
VRNGKTGEPLIGATVQIANTQHGVVTNVDGVYKMYLAPGIYSLNLSCIGFEASQYSVKIFSDGVLDLELFDKAIALDDIVILGERADRNVSGNQMGLIELNARDIRELPSVAGTRDVLKGLTKMPGVKSIGEFSSGINVRGGGEDQNLYLINGAPLFNTAHVFGLLSVVNPEAVEKLTLYKSNIPAYYGERVSSVVEIETGDMAPRKFTLNGGVGLYDARLLTQVPVYKDKVFFDLGARTSYSNLILHQIQDYDLQQSATNFYDLHGSVKTSFRKGYLRLSGYSCFDAFRFASEVKYSYGSQLASLQWALPLGSFLSSGLTLSYSKYHVDKDDIRTVYNQTRTESGLSYTGFSYRLKYGGIKQNVISTGLSATHYQIQPGKFYALSDSSDISPVLYDNETGWEGAVFIQDELSLGKSLTLNLGLRASGYINPQGDFTGGLEPRLFVKWQTGNSTSLKASYNRNYQYLSLITFSDVATPADVWKLSDARFRPVEANQISIGLFHNMMYNTLEASVELYYKNLDNLIECRNGTPPGLGQELTSGLVPAAGRNYGMEWLIKKSGGRWDGWISYSYSRSLRRTASLDFSEVINHNTWYPSSLDRPHDLTLVANWHVNRRFHFGANFTLATGRPISLPELQYSSHGQWIAYYSEKNSYRIPAYHRLDLTLNVDESLMKGKKWKGRWSFSILNLYGRKNAYTVYFKKEAPSLMNDYRQYSLYKLYLIGRSVPSVSYSFIF